MAEGTKDETLAAGMLVVGQAQRHQALSRLPAKVLVEELLSRMQQETVWVAQDDIISLGSRLSFELTNQLNQHYNRFSIRRYHELFHLFYANLPVRPAIPGSTVVDIGCGGANPGGLLFVFLALGAARAFAVDLDEVQHFGMASRALADVAATMLVDGSQIAGNAAIDPHQVLDNLASFHLGKLCAGDLGGLDPNRLRYLQEPASAMSIEDDAADLVFSNAFLEHVPAADAVIRDIARITKPGGIGAHLVDMTDHRRYQGPCHPLAFLAEPGPGMAHWSNRLRRSEFEHLFVANGFDIIHRHVCMHIEVTPELRASFAPAYRDRDAEDLESGIVLLATRKR